MGEFEPTEEQWRKMKNHIKSSKYKKEDFFVFETLAVGDKEVPNRHMRLMPDLLEVMKEDAQKGVSLMLNHNWSQVGVQSIPIGKVFDARIGPGTQEGESEALYTTQYILKDDSKVDGYSKNDIIKLIETGTIADTSVGWGTTADAYKCSICGNSIHDWRKCDHIPGHKYIVNEETNEVKECVIEAHAPTQKHSGNNVLMENSVVFDGAYPNAIIQSKFAEAGNSENGLKVLEGKPTSFTIKPNDIIYGYASNGSINLLYKELMEKGGADKMDEKEKEVLEEKPAEEKVTQSSDPVVEQVEQPKETEEVPAEKEGKELEEPEVSVETAEEKFSKTELLEKFGNIANSVEELVMLAKEGLANRKEVIEASLNSGVRAMANSFEKELFEKSFSVMTTQEIKKMGEAWEKQVSDKFSIGKGKVSTEGKIVEPSSEQQMSNNSDEILKHLKNYKTGNY